MRDNAIPPGDVGASVHVWVDTARKLLELTRSRLHNLMTAAKPSESLKSDNEAEAALGDADNVVWDLPDTLPPPDLLALDRALDGDKTKVI
jgi:hypothetical protein